MLVNFYFEGNMANDNLEDLKNCKRSASSTNSEIMDIDDLIQENGKYYNAHLKKPYIYEHF